MFPSPAMEATRSERKDVVKFREDAEEFEHGSQRLVSRNTASPLRSVLKSKSPNRLYSKDESHRNLYGGNSSYAELETEKLSAPSSYNDIRGNHTRSERSSEGRQDRISQDDDRSNEPQARYGSHQEHFQQTVNNDDGVEDQMYAKNTDGKDNRRIGRRLSPTGRLNNECANRETYTQDYYGDHMLGSGFYGSQEFLYRKCETKEQKSAQKKVNTRNYLGEEVSTFKKSRFYKDETHRQRSKSRGRYEYQSRAEIRGFQESQCGPVLNRYSELPVERRTRYSEFHQFDESEGKIDADDFPRRLDQLGFDRPGQDYFHVGDIGF